MRPRSAMHEMVLRGGRIRIGSGSRWGRERHIPRRRGPTSVSSRGVKGRTPVRTLPSARLGCRAGWEVTHRNIISDILNPTIPGGPWLRGRLVREKSHRNVFSYVIAFILAYARAPEPGSYILRGNGSRLDCGRRFPRQSFRGVGARLLPCDDRCRSSRRVQRRTREQTVVGEPASYP